MTTVRLIASSLLGFLALLVMVGNDWVAVKGLILRRSAPSWIPLLGGLFGCIGLLVSPMESLHAYWWLPLFLDWGSIPGMCHTLWVHARRRKNIK